VFRVGARTASHAGSADLQSVSAAPSIPGMRSTHWCNTFSREDFTFDKTRNVYICPAFKILTTAGRIVNNDQMLFRRANLIATRAHTKCDVAQRSRPARSRAAFMKMPATLPVRSPIQKPSYNPVATESASRCCLPIASASSDSAASGCADRGVRKTSSRSLRPLRTYAVLPSSSPDHRHSQWRALRKRASALVPMRRRRSSLRAPRQTSDRAMV